MRDSCRFASCLALGLALAACSGSSDDDTSPPGADAGDDGDDVPVPASGFQIETPELSIAAGEEVTYCYYTRLPIDEVVGIRKWESVMTPGSHHMIVYFTSQPQKPDGTLDTEPCGVGAPGADPRDPAIWTYAAQDPETEFTLPDGVGMAAAPQQPVIVQMHYLNASDAELTAKVTINGHIYEAGVDYEQAHPYITYDTRIEIPPGEEGSVADSCSVPDGARFISMSTHAHRFSTRAQVFDGDTTLVDSTDWEHPEVVTWLEAPHYSFRGTLDYRCEYFNGSEQTVTEGDSAETDEMCMAVGYYFGADGPYACINGTGFTL